VTRFVFISVLIGAALAAAVSRADDAEFARRGAYLAIGASRGFNEFEDTFHDAMDTNAVRVDDTWGLNARAGYRFTSWFALEGEYEWLDRFEATLGPVDLAQVTTHTLTMNVRFIAPLGRVQPYFMLGVGATIFDVPSPSFVGVDGAVPSGRLGAGFDFYVTRNLLLNVGAEGVLNDAKVDGFSNGHGLDYVALQFGFGYRF